MRHQASKPHFSCLMQLREHAARKISGIGKHSPSLRAETIGSRGSHMIRYKEPQKIVHLPNYFILRPQKPFIFHIYEADSHQGKIINL